MNKQIETPYFLIDKDILNCYFQMLKSSLENNWNNYIIGYSFKTNSLPWLVNYMKKNNAFAEVVSDDEYNLAKYIISFIT